MKFTKLHLRTRIIDYCTLILYLLLLAEGAFKKEMCMRFADHTKRGVNFSELNQVRKRENLMLVTQGMPIKQILENIEGTWKDVKYHKERTYKEQGEI